MRKKTKNASDLNLTYLWRILCRRRWYFIVPFLLILLTGIILAVKLPKVYKAQTLILVQPQKVPSAYVQSVVSTDIDSRINTISQQIMSRSNLNKIIAEFHLFATPEGSRLFDEQKINLLRNKISVEVIRRNRNAPADAFSISFKDRSPETAAKVANALTSYVINENLKAREVQAMGTSQFLKDEQTDIKKKLEAKEALIKKYRQRYMGALPEQLDANLRTLDRLQSQAIARQASLRDARNRLVALDNLIAEKKKIRKLSDRTIIISPQTGEQSIPEDVANLGKLKERLAAIQSRYTDRHPDVVRLKSIIARLEKKIKVTPAASIQVPSSPVPAVNIDPNDIRQRAEIKAEIRSLTADIKQINSKIKYFQKLVDDTPRREQELLSLKRDYENIKATYKSILDRKLEADIAVNLEKKQKGEQFRILDPATVPQLPAEPNMKKLFALVLFAAFSIGGGLVFLKEHGDSSFKLPEDVESFLNLSVLAEVPAIPDRKKIIRQRIRLAFTCFCLFLSLVLLAGFGAVTLAGAETTRFFVQNIISF